MPKRCPASNTVLWDMTSHEVSRRLNRQERKWECRCGRTVGLQKTPKSGADLNDYMVARHNLPKD